MRKFAKKPAASSLTLALEAIDKLPPPKRPKVRAIPYIRSAVYSGSSEFAQVTVGHMQQYVDITLNNEEIEVRTDSGEARILSWEEFYAVISRASRMKKG